MTQPARGSGSGVSRASISRRRDSSWGGRITTDPSCSSGTSTVKPGPVVGDLEQHAARLAEVDRVEVVAVDDAAVRDAGGLQMRVPVGVLGDGRAPGDVVHGAGALAAALLRRLVVARSSPRGGRRAAPTRARRRAPRTGPSPAARRCGPGRARRRGRRRTPAARARPGSRGARRTAGRRRPGARRARARGPRSRRTAACSPSLDARRPRRAAAAPRSRAPRRDPTRETIVCTIPAPGRPGIAPGYSKNVSSEPGRPSSSA